MLFDTPSQKNFNTFAEQLLRTVCSDRPLAFGHIVKDKKGVQALTPSKVMTMVKSNIKINIRLPDKQMQYSTYRIVDHVYLPNPVGSELNLANHIIGLLQISSGVINV